MVKQIIDVSTKGLCPIKVTSDDVIRDHVVILDLVDGLALPELFTLFREPSLLCAPVVLVKNLLLALLELELSLMDSSHVSSFSCPCGA